MSSHRFLTLLRLYARCSPVLTTVCLVLSLVSAAATGLSLVATGQLIGALSNVSIDSGAAWRWLTLMLVALIIGPIAAAISASSGETLAARFVSSYLDLVVDAGVQPIGVRHLEQPTWSDRMTEAAGATRDWLFLLGTSGTWRLVATRLSGLAVFAIVASWRWWVPIALLATWLLLSRAETRWASTLFDEMADATGHDRRRARYLRASLANRSSAKEVRLFGLVDWLSTAYISSWQHTMAVVQRHRWHGMRGMRLPLLLVITATGLAVTLLLHDVWVGSVAPGRFITVALAVLGLSAFGPQGDDQNSTDRVANVLSHTIGMRVDLGLPALPAPPAAAPRPRSVNAAATVEISQVSFTYPDSQRPVLRDLSLTVPAGQSLGIVGPNGAGKSTLIKLICGLYSPEHGTVRIDGLNPETTDARQRVSVIFQEFLRFALSARANIEAGTGWSKLPAERLDAIADQAGLDGLISTLQRDWDTPLSPEYAGGQELSGGQWQRIALARALAGVDHGAGLLVLDEPTSALDIRAEIALFEELLRLSGRTTTLLVSHRLSGVRQADRIVVLDEVEGVAGATIVEDGTHNELIRLGGRYADMFTLQASRFASSGQDLR